MNDFDLISVSIIMKKVSCILGTIRSTRAILRFHICPTLPRNRKKTTQTKTHTSCDNKNKYFIKLNTSYYCCSVTSSEAVAELVALAVFKRR